MEVWHSLPEGTLAEVIDGTLSIIPIPNLQHQEVLTALCAEIYIFLKETRNEGCVLPLRTGVFLNETENVVMPDVIFVSSENSSILHKDAIHGSPDFMLEILSPLNKNHDRKTKKNLYERFGIKEYWIVEPEKKEAVGYKIVKGKYQEFARAIGKIQSKVLKATIKF